MTIRTCVLGGKDRRVSWFNRLPLYVLWIDRRNWTVSWFWANRQAWQVGMIDGTFF